MLPPRTLPYIVPVLLVALVLLPALAQQSRGPVELPKGNWKPPSYSEQKKTSQPEPGPEQEPTVPGRQGNLTAATDLAIRTTDWPHTEALEIQITEDILNVYTICPGVSFVTIGDAVGRVYAQESWSAWRLRARDNGWNRDETVAMALATMRLVMHSHAELLEHNGCP